MSRRVEDVPEEEVTEVNSDDEGTIDLALSGDEDDNPLPSPVVHPGTPEDEEEEEDEEEDEEALTNRQFNEQFVYHTTPQSPSARYPSPPPLRHHHHHPTNNEQLGNHQATETGKFSFNKDVFY